MPVVEVQGIFVVAFDIVVLHRALPDGNALHKPQFRVSKFMKNFVRAVALIAPFAAGNSAASASDMPVGVISDVRRAVIDERALGDLKRKRAAKKAIADEVVGTSLRTAAIRQEALRVGAQTGLSMRYQAIIGYLDQNESRLNVLFNFAPFVDGKLLMPAVSKMQDTFSVNEDSGSATIIRNSYTITEEARIISNAPTWRDYLYQVYDMPEESHYSVLPATPTEIAAWESSVEEGWKAGITMADEVFSDRLASLSKSLEDRYRYQLLLNQGVVTKPVVGVDARTITYNGRTLNVGETIYTVEQPANYTASPSWRPVWTK